MASQYQIITSWTVKDPHDDEGYRVYTDTSTHLEVEDWLKMVEHDCKNGHWLKIEETFLPARAIYKVHLEDIGEIK